MHIITTGLPSNFTLASLVEVVNLQDNVEESSNIKCGSCSKSTSKIHSFCSHCNFICGSCRRAHGQLKALKRHQLTSWEDIKTGKQSVVSSGLCSKHDDEVTKFYCLDCKEFICRDCTDDDHEGHVTKLISLYAKQEKKELSNYLEVIKEKLKVLKEKLVEARQQKEKLQTKGDLDIKRTEELIDLVVQSLLERKCHLVAGIKQCTAAVKKPLEEYEQELGFIIDQMESCVQFSAHLLEPAGSVDNREVLGMKPQVVQRVAHLNKMYQQCNDLQCQPHIDDFGVVFNLAGQETIQKMCSSLVYLAPCAQKCYITGDGVQNAYKNKTNNFLVHLRDVSGVGVINQGAVVKVDIQKVSNGDMMEYQLKEQDGGYKVIYQPTEVGEHKVNVMVNSKLVPGSPFTLQVLPPYCNEACRKFKTVTKYGEGKRFGMLWGVAISCNQDIALTDSSNNCVIILDKDYKLKRVIVGHGDGQLRCPRGVTFINKGTMLVADKNNHRIQKFSVKGQSLYKFGSHGSDNGQFNEPTGISVSQDGMIFVADWKNHRIQVFNVDCSFAYKFGSRGNNTGQFEDCYDVFVDGLSRLFVTDLTLNRIQVFSLQGDFISSITTCGHHMPLKEPCCIVTDKDGYLLVTERRANRISVFDCDYHYVTSFNECSQNPYFNSPYGININQQGDVIAVVLSNQRGQIFCFLDKLC